ncbi:MAG: HDOD domain-containing protein [Myxococcaceae bacterium]|nr:HDOD domain-containing protein [Myxococcaceae bacterium]
MAALSLAAPEQSPPAPSPVVERMVAFVQGLVTKRLTSDALFLPPLPMSATQALNAINQPNFALRDAVPILERDPLLAARVFRLANSAAFSTGERSVTLIASVTRLGARQLRTIIVESATDRLFHSRDPEVARMCARAWQHSAAVALAARDLCLMIGRDDGDEACLSGLLHDIGKPVVATVLLEAEKQVVEGRGGTFIGSQDWYQVISRTHRPVTQAIAEKWGMPSAVLKCIHESAEFDPNERVSLGNLLCFVNALVKVAGLATGDDIDAARTLTMIGHSMLGIDRAITDKLMSNIKDRVSDISV